MSFPHLKKRRSFLSAAASGQRFRCGAFLLQSKKSLENDEVGVGFTATRQLGKAVQRNRARRRLKAALRIALQEEQLLNNRQYVLVARAEVFTMPFEHLTSSLKKGLQTVSKEKAP